MFHKTFTITLLSLCILYSSTVTTKADYQDALSFNDKKTTETKAPSTYSNPTKLDKLIVDKKTFEKYSKVHKVIPLGDETLSFSIRLANQGWEELDVGSTSSLSMSQRLFGNIARFRGPVIENSRPYVIVQSLQIEHEILAKHWLKNHIFSNGFTLQGKIKDISNTHANAAYVYLNNNQSYLVYSTAQIFDNHVIFVRFELPIYATKRFYQIQKNTIESFVFTNPTFGKIEETAKFALMNALKFEYPKSWETKNNNFKNPAFLTSELHNMSAIGALDGIIRFEAIRRTKTTALKEEIDKLRARFVLKRKMLFKKLFYSEDLPSYARFEYAKLEKYIVGFEQNRYADHELWLHVLADENWYIFIYLLSPLEDSNLKQWARNTRTMTLIAETFQ